MMKRLPIILTLLLLLLLPAAALAGSTTYLMLSKAGARATNRTTTGSCSLANSGTDLRAGCGTNPGSLSARWVFPLTCTPSGRPSISVSWGDVTGEPPDVTLRQLSSGKYAAVLRLSSAGHAVIHRVSIGYYC